MLRAEASDASEEGGKSKRIRHLQRLGRVSFLPAGLADQRTRRPELFGEHG